MREKMELSWPSRVVAVGGSMSGKTYLIRSMILRGDWGVPKDKLDILIISPVKASIEQAAWSDLYIRGYNIYTHHVNTNIKNERFPTDFSLFTKNNLLIIIDDCDHIREIKGGREWLLDVYGTESHHSNISVCLITHHLKFGAPAVLASSDIVIICNLPSHEILTVCKQLGLTKDETYATINELRSINGAVESSSEYIPAFNHVIVWRKPMFSTIQDEEGKIKALIPAPTLYRFGSGILKKALVPIELQNINKK